mmetsp:Transcript_15733/g.59858  ORF Transcript_15733/g.59858 Transcript_15733/m.59858 type:complete len:334 (+) Transcript_15733:1972-2973(+)
MRWEKEPSHCTCLLCHDTLQYLYFLCTPFSRSARISSASGADESSVSLRLSLATYPAFRKGQENPRGLALLGASWNTFLGQFTGQRITPRDESVDSSASSVDSSSSPSTTSSLLAHCRVCFRLTSRALSLATRGGIFCFVHVVDGNVHKAGQRLGESDLHAPQHGGGDGILTEAEVDQLRAVQQPGGEGLGTGVANAVVLQVQGDQPWRGLGLEGFAAQGDRSGVSQQVVIELQLRQLRRLGQAVGKRGGSSLANAVRAEVQLEQARAVRQALAAEDLHAVIAEPIVRQAEHLQDGQAGKRLGRQGSHARGREIVAVQMQPLQRGADVTQARR